MLIDSHTHIYLPEFDDDFSEMIEQARNAGVRYFLMPNVDVESIPQMHRAQDRLPDHAFPMMGLHPCSVKDDFETQLEVIKRHLFQPVRKYWAVGEIGIDLYWDKSTLDIQVKAFEMQIEWAKALKLPIVIHVRDAFDEIFEVLDRVHDEHLRGVFHCFTGTKEQAQKIRFYRQPHPEIRLKLIVNLMSLFYPVPEYDSGLLLIPAQSISGIFGHFLFLH